MEISFFPEKLIEYRGIPVSNAMLMSWLAMSFLTALSLAVRKKIKEVPGRLQNIVEMLIEVMVGFMTTVTGDKEKTRKFFPLVATIFLFVLVSNWMGIFPGVSSLMVKEVHDGHEVFIPLLRSTNSDLNMTLALGLISVFAIQMFGVVSVGFFKHTSKFFTFSSPLKFFLGLLEFIGEVAKIISFSFRLFGNVFAGEVLLAVIFFLIPLFVPLPFLFLEIFVGFIQALVFAMLTLVFLTIATSKEH